MRLSKFLPIIFLSLIYSSQILAKDKGIVIRTSTVYLNASAGSTVVGKLESGTEVDILDSRSGWKLIFHVDGTLTGWVRRYQLRTGHSRSLSRDKESDEGGFMSGLAAISRSVSSFFSPDDDASKSSSVTATLGVRGRSSVATLGVRGLSESDLKAAKPNPQELEKLKLYGSSANRVERFAVDGKLRARDVSMLE